MVNCVISFGKDAIITVDVGDHTYWFYKKFIWWIKQTPRVQLGPRNAKQVVTSSGL